MAAWIAQYPFNAESWPTPPPLHPVSGTAPVPQHSGSVMLGMKNIRWSGFADAACAHPSSPLCSKYSLPAGTDPALHVILGCHGWLYLGTLMIAENVHWSRFVPPTG